MARNEKPLKIASENARMSAHTSQRQVISTPDWQRQREELLSAARKLLQERSYNDITLEDITQLSGLSLQTLLLHFNDKETVYIAAVNDELDTLLRLLIGSYDSRATPLANLLAALDAATQFDGNCHWQDELPILRSMNFVEGFPPHCSHLLDEKLGRSAAHLKRVLDEGVTQGHFRSMDTGRVAVLHLTMSQGYIQALLLTRRTFKQGHDTAEDFQEVRRSFQELITGGVSVQPPNAQNRLGAAQTHSAVPRVTLEGKLSCLLPKL